MGKGSLGGNYGRIFLLRRAIFILSHIFIHAFRSSKTEIPLIIIQGIHVLL